MAQMLTGTLQPPPAQAVPPMEDEQPITAKQEAMEQRVAPAMGASFGALSGAISSTNNRVEVLGGESSKFEATYCLDRARHPLLAD